MYLFKTVKPKFDEEMVNGLKEDKAELKKIREKLERHERIIKL